MTSTRTTVALEVLLGIQWCSRKVDRRPLERRVDDWIAFASRVVAGGGNWQAALLQKLA